MTSIENPQTVDDVLKLCKHLTPVNVPVSLAIDAHLKSVCPWLDHEQSYRALDAVICAMTETVEQAQKQLDYLESLPDIAWRCGPGEWEKRVATYDALRRSIAWRQQN